MAEPVTLAVVGGIVLTEGIKFLYSQAGEILKRWRDRQDVAEKEGAAQPETTEPIDIKLPPEAFQGQLSEPQIHFDALKRVEGDLREVRKSISEYAEGIEKVDNQDMKLLTRVDALRQMLEAVLQERITFQGENRPPSGPVVRGSIDADEVAGYAAAVRAGRITGGRTEAEAKAKRVEKGGEFIGVDVDTIGNEH